MYNSALDCLAKLTKFVAVLTQKNWSDRAMVSIIYYLYIPFMLLK